MIWNSFTSNIYVLERLVAHNIFLKDETSYMIQLLALLDFLKSRENKKCCGREQAQGHNGDCYGKHKSMIFIWDNIPKGWKIVSKKMRSPKNKQKCIIVFEKKRKEKGKKKETIFEKDRKISLSCMPSLLFLFAYCFSEFLAIIVCWFWAVDQDGLYASTHPFRFLYSLTF